MNVIYEPKGKAGEYSPLAVNLYRGCDHGCTYCYAPAATRTARETFSCPVPRPDIITKLRKDARELGAANDTRQILMSFTCDPYQVADMRHELTRQALAILLAEGLNVTILSKGGNRVRRDFDIATEYTNQVTYAATLVFTDETRREKYEPGAAPTTERISVLADAHGMGFKTWASLEPVFDPVQTFDLIERTHEFVDLYKVGVLNYMPEAKEIDWHEFGSGAVKLLESLNKEYYIKQDLRKYL